MSESKQNNSASLFIVCRRMQGFLVGTAVIVMLLWILEEGSGAMVSNIPKEIKGWAVDREVQIYDRKTIFQYIDGGAELYLAYSFHKAHVYTYRKEGSPDIVMNIYDMGTPEDAFGVFASERAGDDVGIGQGSEYEAGLLRFYKGRYFISIMALDETPQTKPAILALATAVAEDIQSTGDRPGLLLSLPRKGLIERSIRYFYNHTLLNHYYYVADENILLLGSHTRAVLAQYSLNQGKPYVLLVRYPSIEEARKALKSFLQAYMQDAVEGMVQTEKGRWTAAVLNESILAIVFDAPTRAGALSLLKEVCPRPGGEQ